MRIIVVLLFLGTAICSTGQLLSPWTPGYLDIHHISTGSGNSAFMILPDGTTLLVDAGDVNSPQKPSPVYLKTSPRLLSDTLSAARVINLYVRQAKPGIERIDYALITHFHGDHMGVVSTISPPSRRGHYKLNGFTEVDEYIPLSKVFDRAYPDYNIPFVLRIVHQDTATFRNYLKFVNTRTKGTVEKLVAGRDDQIVLLHKPKDYKLFSVMNVKSNGDIWKGEGNKTINVLPASIDRKHYNENPLSIGVKVNLGEFDYFTGGDMPGIVDDGMPAWFDVETPVSKVIGEVDAISLNHHGVRDAVNENFLRATKPRVLVQQSWSSNHPGEEVLHRMISKSIITGPRDIFATYIHQATIDTYGRWMTDNYKSMRGHIVIRVVPDGSSYQVYILDDTKKDLIITSTFGPYESR